MSKNMLRVFYSRKCAYHLNEDGADSSSCDLCHLRLRLHFLVFQEAGEQNRCGEQVLGKCDKSVGR